MWKKNIYNWFEKTFTWIRSCENKWEINEVKLRATNNPINFDKTLPFNIRTRNMKSISVDRKWDCIILRNRRHTTGHVSKTGPDVQGKTTIYSSIDISCNQNYNIWFKLNLDAGDFLFIFKKHSEFKTRETWFSKQQKCLKKV